MVKGVGSREGSGDDLTCRKEERPQRLISDEPARRKLDQTAASHQR
jgi:hypothetical protein